MKAKLVDFCKGVIATGYHLIPKLFLGGKKLSIKILLHHRVYPIDHLGLSIRPELFDAEIHFLSQTKKVISLDEAIEKLQDDTSSGEYFVITFDDGYLDNYTHALPLLERYNVPATIFVTTRGIDGGILHWDILDSAILNANAAHISLEDFGLGHIDLPGAKGRKWIIRDLHAKLKKIPDAECRRIILSIAEQLGTATKERLMLDRESLSALAASTLITIGSHTVTHPIMTRIDLAQIGDEVRESRRVLKELTGKPVHFFAYPNGGPADYHAGIVDILAEEGYRAACTTLPGDNDHQTPLFELRRIDVTPQAMVSGNGKFSPVRFDAHLSGIYEKIKEARASFRRDTRRT